MTKNVRRNFTSAGEVQRMREIPFAVAVAVASPKNATPAQHAAHFLAIRAAHRMPVL